MTKTEAYRKDVSDKAKEINALKSQLAAERGKVKEARWQRDVILQQSNKDLETLKALEQQLAAERDWIAKFCGYDEKSALDAYVAKQLAAEREKHELTPRSKR